MRASQLRCALLRVRHHLRLAVSACALGLAVSACGGSDAGQTSDNSTELPTTVSGADGASVRLRTLQRDAAQRVTVRVARDGTGAPPLGEGYTPLGAVYQFTPLGWVEQAIEIRVPFSSGNEAGNATPHLLIAQPGGDWQAVADARVDGRFMVARVPHLAYATVAASTAASGPSDRIRALGARIAGLSASSALALSFDAAATQPALPAADANGIATVTRATSLGLTLQYALPTGCTVAPVVSAYAAVWSPVTQTLKTIQLGSRRVANNTGAEAYAVPLSASDNGNWVFASLAYCKEPGRPLPRYGVVSAGPGLVVDIGTSVPEPLPTVTGSPQDVSVVEGAAASFNVMATGEALSYTWQRSNDGGVTYAAVSAPSAPSYSLTAALADNNALFRVLVSNANGSVTSTPAKLSVTAHVTAPAITSDPANQTVLEGQTASFSVAGSGQPAPTVQWQQRTAAHADPEAGWADIAGATAATYTTPETTLAQSGAQFRAQLRNSGGIASSLAAALTVNAKQVAPGITTGPVSQTVQADFFASFSVGASGTTPLSYQWFKNGQAITGANADTVQVYADPADVGQSHAITVTVSNALGTVTSAAASLTVAAPAGTPITAAAGGTVAGPDGSSLELPAGALGADATVALRRVPQGSVDVPVGFTPLGDAVEITPSDLRFAQPAVLNLPNPAAVPDGQELALLEFEPAADDPLRASINASSSVRVAFGARANPRRLSQAASAMPRIAALGAGPASVTCLSQQSIGNLTSVLSRVSGLKQLGAVASAACGGVIQAPLAPAGGIPSTSIAACGSDGEFADASLGNEATLVNRHVACLKSSEGTASAINIFDPKVATGVGSALVHMRASMSGPSNSLSKRITVQQRFSFTPYAANDPTPRLKMVVGVECSPACNATPPVVVQSAGSSWTGNAAMSFDVAFPTQAGTSSEFSVKLVLYAGHENVPDADVAQRNNVTAASSVTLPTLRCDVNLAWGKTGGCVFSEASPVFALLASDNVPQSRLHIQDAFKVIGPDLMPSIPGQWALKAGTRTVAADAVSGASLSRARNRDVINANRRESNTRCKRQFGQLPPPAPEVCEIVNDPDDVPAPCDCDEFPFASTYQGAFGAGDWSEYSVRRISSSDNRSSGNKLGVFYRRERLIDRDNFWVAVP